MTRCHESSSPLGVGLRALGSSEDSLGPAWPGDAQEKTGSNLLCALGKADLAFCFGLQGHFKSSAQQTVRMGLLSPASEHPPPWGTAGALAAPCSLWEIGLTAQGKH